VQEPEQRPQRGHDVVGVTDPVPRALAEHEGVHLAGVKVFDAAAVQSQYGVPPERYVDFAILRGDPSDGLPGVKGIGEKTARDLVQRYPTLDALLADAAAQPPRLATSLLAAHAYIAAMRKVVPVRTDAALQTIADAPDDAGLDELAATHRIGGPVRRLRAAQNATMGRT